MEIAKLYSCCSQQNQVNRNYQHLKDFEYLETSSTRSFSQKFHIIDTNQLRRLVAGFELPDVIRIRGSKFSGEEVLMISLIRLAYPVR